MNTDLEGGPDRLSCHAQKTEKRGRMQHEAARGARSDLERDREASRRARPLGGRNEVRR
jgi:hypothetical protein